MKSSCCYGIFLSILIISSCVGQSHYGSDWSRALTANLNRLHTDLQGNIQHLNQQIQQNVQGQLAHVQQQVQASLAEAQEAVKKANKNGTKGQNIIITNGQSIVLNNGVHNSGGTSRTIYSGRTADGEYYTRDSEDKILGDTLYHTDRIYNRDKNNFNEFRYSLDLKDPNAKPIPIPVPKDEESGSKGSRT